MNSLIVYSEGRSISVPVANGFVARVVGWIAAENIPDALRVAEILNTLQVGGPAMTATHREAPDA